MAVTPSRSGMWRSITTASGASSSACSISSNGNFPAVRPQTDRSAVALIGASLDLGAGRRGVDMGPSAIRYAGLEARVAALGRLVEDWGNVATAVAEAVAVGAPSARFLDQILGSCERVAELVALAEDRGFMPVVLGGDHSIAIGTLWGL